jgi:hypothetical protein
MPFRVNWGLCHGRCTCGNCPSGCVRHVASTLVLVQGATISSPNIASVIPAFRAAAVWLAMQYSPSKPN